MSTTQADQFLKNLLVDHRKRKKAAEARQNACFVEHRESQPAGFLALLTKNGVYALSYSEVAAIYLQTSPRIIEIEARNGVSVRISGDKDLPVIYRKLLEQKVERIVAVSENQAKTQGVVPPIVDKIEIFRGR